MVSTGDSCPRCGNSNRVRKVSAAYAQEEGRTYSYTLGDNQTLAQRLYPPSKFYSSRGLVVTMLVLSTFSCGIMGGTALCVSVGLFLERPYFLLAFPVFAIGILILVLWGIVNIYTRHYAQRLDAGGKERAQVQFDRWNELYYCELHDIAFVPGTEIIMSSDKVQDYIRGE